MALLVALGAACVGPTDPSPSLSTTVVITVSPPDKLARPLATDPFRWTVSWTVNVAPGPAWSSTRPISVDSVHARLEAPGGQLLAERLRIVTERIAQDTPVQVSQTAIYATDVSPPTSSRLVVVVQVSDDLGHAEEVTATGVIEESLCGRKGQLPCDGATIELSDTGAAPTAVTIDLGQRVMFSNRHALPHVIRPDVASAECAPLDVGAIAGLENATSGTFLAVGTCGYHDDTDPSNVALQGTVTVRPLPSTDH